MIARVLEFSTRERVYAQPLELSESFASPKAENGSAWVLCKFFTFTSMCGTYIEKLHITFVRACYIIFYSLLLKMLVYPIIYPRDTVMRAKSFLIECHNTLFPLISKLYSFFSLSVSLFLELWVNEWLLVIFSQFRFLSFSKKKISSNKIETQYYVNNSFGKNVTRTNISFELLPHNNQASLYFSQFLYNRSTI